MEGAGMMVRQAEVFIAEVSNTAERYITRVTLPAAPWEDGQPLDALKAQRAALRMSAQDGQTCAAPGCNAILKLGNTSGVCSAHNHAKGACRCKTCRRSTGRLARA
jgi:hypothetical protein